MKNVLIALLIPIVIVSVCGCVSSDPITQNSTQTCSTTGEHTETTRTATTHVSTVTSVPSLSSAATAPTTHTHPSAQPSVRTVTTPSPTKAPAYPQAAPSATKIPTTPAANGPFYGCKACGVYHYSWCPEVAKILPANLVTFNSAEEARAAGMHPCSVCHPP